MAKSNCEDCKLRAKYDQNSRSLLGRFWRWHIGFCPGWKAYLLSLEGPDRDQICEQYHIVSVVDE